MKGLIFSITTGQGHNQTAKVIAEGLRENGIDCEYMDVYEYTCIYLYTLNLYIPECKRDHGCLFLNRSVLASKNEKEGKDS